MLVVCRVEKPPSGAENKHVVSFVLFFYNKQATEQAAPVAYVNGIGGEKKLHGASTPVAQKRGECLESERNAHESDQYA